MIKGIGTDLCHISRMRKAVERRHFIDRVFTQCEIDYAREHGDPARHYASAYAAKEALAKAGGWGLMRMGLKNCWVRRTANGPVMEWNEPLADLLLPLSVQRCWVTLSHEDDLALAFVVLES